MLDDSTRRRTAVLLPAAGRGERLKLGPKALLPLGKGTMLQVALQPFRQLGLVCYVAVAPEMHAAAKVHLAPDVHLIRGGASRQASVHALLEACEAEVVLVHDAARPFLPRRVLLAVLGAAWRTGAATVAQLVADSLLDAATGEPQSRERLRAVQTPQGFRRSLLLEAHRRALEHSVQATDDAELVRRLGQPVTLVEGSSWLMKITTPDDYRMAQLLAPYWPDAEA